MPNDRIERNPKVMVGKPVIRGTRITVELVVRLLAKGHTVDELAKSYQIAQEDSLAASVWAPRRIRQ